MYKAFFFLNGHIWNLCFHLPSKLVQDFKKGETFSTYFLHLYAHFYLAFDNQFIVLSDLEDLKLTAVMYI